MADYIEIEEIESNFAQVPKPALKDKNLSLKAKGLYAYLFSLPRGWKVYRTELLEHLSDGKDSLNSAFKELESFGYLQSTAVRDKGQFKGYRLKLLINSLFNTDELQPLRKNRNGKNRSGKTGAGKSAPINNDNNNTSLFNNKEESDIRKIFIDEFNLKRSSSFRLTKQLKEHLSNCFKDYSYKDALKALGNAMLSKYHIQNSFNDLTPEFITRPDKLEKYLNYKITEEDKGSNKEFVIKL